MRLTPVRRATSGAVLARDVDTGHPGGVPLLRAGVRLTDRYRARLEEAGIQAVWIDDGVSSDIAPLPLLSPQVRRRASRKFETAMGDVARALDENRTVADGAIAELTELAELIAREVMRTPEVALAIEDLAASDAYTHRHSVNVCAIGMLIGRRLFREHGWVDGTGSRRLDRLEHRLRMLGLGLLLHDIGKLTVPSEVLSKPGPLNPAEWRLMEEHPDAGVALLPHTISPLIKSVVRDHHERFDGTGYPRGLKGTEIGQLPRVAAVADVYDAMTSQRRYAQPKPPHEAVDLIRRGSGRMFDPDVVEVFLQVVFPYPEGTEVALTDGRLAVVARVDMGRPEEPVVRVLGSEARHELRVDLRAETRARERLSADAEGRPVALPVEPIAA